MSSRKLSREMSVLHPKSTFSKRQPWKPIINDILKDSEQYSREKLEFARNQGLHAFNMKTKRCMLCGESSEIIKRKSKLVPILFNGVRLEAYPGCIGKFARQHP